MGAYGTELESCLRRQGRSENDHLWRKKLEIPISNRIALSAVSGRCGNYPVGGTCDLSIALTDCFALGASTCKNRKWGGEKLAPVNKEPQTSPSLVSSAKRHIRLYGMLYGTEHGMKGLAALEQLRRCREENQSWSPYRPSPPVGKCCVSSIPKLPEKERGHSSIFCQKELIEILFTHLI